MLCKVLSFYLDINFTISYFRKLDVSWFSFSFNCFLLQPIAEFYPKSAHLVLTFKEKSQESRTLVWFIFKSAFFETKNVKIICETIVHLGADAQTINNHN